MLDHIGYRVRDVAVSQGFFQRALRPLGITELMSVSAEQSGSATFCGFGANGKAFFWISDGKTPTETVHVAFAAATRARSMASMQPPWGQAAVTMARRGSGRTTTRTTMGHSCSTRTATTSKPSATPPPDAPVRRDHSGPI